ncbi:hypothetical protein ENUP19_0253G0040 [Entamoeba nuttalli]|uniref:Uncharacterized protein n=2 Tax=Entamoeba nuttalli TaxID=412467 RepID=K2HNK0_ENTNP|nr:hypothetical protein ENU1_197160 [Entamoeba nuttalli P19]EKE37445.1 hypothetical protein ENU1_197160 [Entamoeba nuttalli P19]|eukprot:XP_008860221.1 hypothetical protein ENU1_197160 [Entamoeba nuttalli P19]
MSLDESYLQAIICQMRTISEVIKLIQVSKRWKKQCFLVEDVTPFCESKQSDEFSEEEWEGEVICRKDISLKRVVQLFKRCKRVAVNAEDIEQFDWEGNCLNRYDEQLESVSEIILHGILTSDDLIEEIGEKIVEINVTICYYDDINFSRFPNLRKCHIDLNNEPLKVDQLFPNALQPLSLLRINHCKDYKKLYGLIRFKNFERVIIEVDETITEEEIKTLDQFAILVTRRFFDGMDSRILALDCDYCNDWGNEEGNEVFIFRAPRETNTSSVIVSSNHK